MKRSSRPAGNIASAVLSAVDLMPTCHWCLGKRFQTPNHAKAPFSWEVLREATSLLVNHWHHSGQMWDACSCRRRLQICVRNGIAVPSWRSWMEQAHCALNFDEKNWIRMMNLPVRWHHGRRSCLLARRGNWTAFLEDLCSAAQTLWLTVTIMTISWNWIDSGHMTERQNSDRFSNTDSWNPWGAKQVGWGPWMTMVQLPFLMFLSC